MGPINSLQASTGSSTVAMSVTAPYTLLLKEIRLTLSAATTDLDEFVVSLDSMHGAAFDHTLAAPDPDADLTSATSFRFADPAPPVIFAGEKIIVTWPNAGTVTWGVDIIVRPVY